MVPVRIAVAVTDGHQVGADALVTEQYAALSDIVARNCMPLAPLTFNIRTLASTTDLLRVAIDTAQISIDCFTLLRRT